MRVRSVSGPYSSASHGIRNMVCALSHFSRVQLFVTAWTVAHQAPLTMGFSRQECWNRLPCPPPGALPDPGIRPVSLVSCLLLWQASSLPLAPRFIWMMGLLLRLASLDQRVRDSILMAHPLNKEVSTAEKLQRTDFLVCYCVFAHVLKVRKPDN